MLDEAGLETVPLPCGTMLCVNVIRNVVLVIARVGLAGSVRAATFLPIEDACNGRQALIQGPIEPGDYRRFLAFMADHVGGDAPSVQDPDVLWTVELDSPGGDLSEAMRIGRFLRAALATTEVTYRYARRPDGVLDYARGGELVCLEGQGRLSGCEADLIEAECTGACLLIWLGGATRHANEGRLGTHGLADGDAVAGYLDELGVAPAWRTRLTVSGAADGWLGWPERHELGGRADELVSLLAGCPPPLSRDESFESVAAPSAQLRARLMDRAAAHRACRRAREAEVRQSVKQRLDAGAT